MEYVKQLFDNELKDNLDLCYQVLKKLKETKTEKADILYILIQNMLIDTNENMKNIMETLVKSEGVQDITRYCCQITRQKDVSSQAVIYDVELFFSSIIQRIYINNEISFSDKALYDSVCLFIKTNQSFFNMFFSHVWLPQIDEIVNSTYDEGNVLSQQTTLYYEASARIISDCILNNNASLKKAYFSRFKNFCKGRISYDEVLSKDSSNTLMS